MFLHVPGSESFASQTPDHDGLRTEIGEKVGLHTVTDEQVAALDPLTYEVIRHRLWSITDDMGSTLRRMSGSHMVTEANDFDFTINDEVGREAQVGLYNTMLVGAIDMAIDWILRNRADNPGIADGDMFLCNDPWVGGGLHQNDVLITQPIFVGDELFGWTAAVCHEPDLGGPNPGSGSTSADDVFGESLPTPPVRVVHGFEIQRDVADVWVRRSRVPHIVGLDLRAKVGANLTGRRRLLDTIEKYGADTVKAVMRRMMDDAEKRLRDKLHAVPDGTWSAEGYQDQAKLGDTGTHRISVTMSKANDHLTFDFTGTDPQTGVINCTFGGLRGAIMMAVLPTLASDIPWSAGGIMRCFDIVSEPGTINNATFPAAISRAPVGPAWLTGTLITQCLSAMLGTAEEPPGPVNAACCGTWEGLSVAGLDERDGAGTPFLYSAMDPMAGGFGAAPDADGVDTGGLLCIPMGRSPDVEMTEYLYPVLSLWRKELPDSGGPGRHRGGVSAGLALTPHGTSAQMRIGFAASGKATSQNPGLSGGYPGSTGYDGVVRGTRLEQLLAAGRLPTELDQLGGDLDPGGCFDVKFIGPGDVVYLQWQGGGGYGDPLLRVPESVAEDVLNGHVTPQAASAIYGVVLDDDGEADLGATAELRERLRAERVGRDRTTRKPESRPETQIGKPLDDNLDRLPDDTIACRHCATALGSAGEPLTVELIEAPPAAAGPHIGTNPELYIDAQVGFRQHVCPGCGVALRSTVGPLSASSVLHAVGAQNAG
ncbi:hydantoinase B/oxoprolinase family protein [Actinomadura montaniterrae]|uniref:Hydantoinase B/oxoprolinase family protein n=1 Tax=Actinomadura montaniterrae TaxID=1803903 RepID=A0A6L3W0R2_9ACTN|nr:hydantoinase B/oxoprolinase family protein [Actinomadura montaniterrae]KAB2384825.1 hydantoinase B/oxoprolinase family protein [Actinomadura montaniterrae]